jgi:purine-binding chemotaxis protein CheW
MAGCVADSVAVFLLDEMRFALRTAEIQRVVRAVEITPLPGAPQSVAGVVNVEGKIVPVFDLRLRFGLPSRELRLSDHLVVAHTKRRPVGLMVDVPVEVVSCAERPVTSAAMILPHLATVEGVMMLDDEIVLIHDLERFLSVEDHTALDSAMGQ